MANSALNNILKSYSYELGGKNVTKQFADDKAERQFRRDNPYDDYSKAKEMKFLSDIDKMSGSNSGVSDLQMDEYKKLQQKWNYNSGIKEAPSRTNSGQTIPDFMGMTPDMIQQAMNGFGSGSQYYDPSKDPVYNSMLELSQKQADKAGLQAMESMNDRGILNSTITADRVGQIKQGASDAVLGAIPGLAGNFDAKQSANSAGLQNLLNSVLGAGQFQQTFAEDNSRFDRNFQLDEAAVTGRYASVESKAAMNELASAMAILQSKTSTPEQKIVAQRKADAANQALSVNGINSTGVNSGMNLQQMLGKVSTLSTPTLAWKQQQIDSDLNKGKLAFDQDQLAFDRESFGREMNYKEQDAMINADLKSRGLDLEQIRANISMFTAESDADYKQFQKSIGMNDQTAKTNTNAAISEVMKAKTAAVALELLANAGDNWAQSGVDMREVLKAVESRFPGTTKPTKTSAPSSTGGGRYGTTP